MNRHRHRKNQGKQYFEDTQDIFILKEKRERTNNAIIIMIGEWCTELPQMWAEYKKLDITHHRMKGFCKIYSRSISIGETRGHLNSSNLCLTVQARCMVINGYF